jgi:GTP-binding protein HflX
VKLPNGRLALFTDTVGFIQKLPTTLVAAFRATLEEISEADLLLHVVDITHPNAIAQAQAVRDTLVEIDAQSVPMVTALNKIDLFDEQEASFDWVDEFERAVPTSALNGDGVSTLLTTTEFVLFDSMVPIEVHLPHHAGSLVNTFHEQGIIESVEHLQDVIVIEGRVPARMIDLFRNYVATKRAESGEESVES